MAFDRCLIKDYLLTYNCCPLHTDIPLAHRSNGCVFCYYYYYVFLYFYFSKLSIIRYSHIELWSDELIFASALVNFLLRTTVAALL